MALVTGERNQHKIMTSGSETQRESRNGACFGDLFNYNRE